MPDSLRTHPVLTLWTVITVILITVEVRTRISGIYSYVVAGATGVLILVLTQAWIVDALKLRRQRPLEREPVTE